MKKHTLITSILLGFSGFAFANGFILDFQERKIPVQSNTSVFMVQEEVNLNAALHMKDIEYFKSMVAKDPNVVTNINKLKPINPVGFAVIDKAMFNVVYATSPDFINSLNRTNKNYVSFMVTEWFEKLESEYATNRMKEIGGFIKDKIPEVKTKNEAFLERPSEKDLNDVLVFAIGKMSPESLNAPDIFKNTSLHYLVHKRLYEPTEALLKNTMFYRKQGLNEGNENALFMLLDQPCNMKTTKEEEQKMLDLLLENKINPLQRNKSGYTFSAFVLGDDKYEHLRETLLKKLSPVQTRLAEQDAQKFKVAKELSTRNNQDFDFYLSFNHTTIEDFYTCKNEMLEVTKKK